MTASVGKGGRPRKPAGALRTANLNVALTVEEMQAVKAAAGGRQVSAAVREHLLTHFAPLGASASGGPKPA